MENKFPVTLIPNPLISESKLNYNIASTERVIINLYNENGSLIRQIKNEMQGAGSYSLTINTQNLHMGNYFLSVIAGNQHAVINMRVDGN